jgi:hypothetical protein
MGRLEQRGASHLARIYLFLKGFSGFRAITPNSARRNGDREPEVPGDFT